MLNIDKLREEIDSIDTQLVELFEKRMQVAKSICKYKKENKMPIYNGNREEQLLLQRTNLLNDGELSHFAQRFFSGLMEISRDYQTNLSLNKNIVLIGIMGCGKTKKGTLLAERLNIPFVDVDLEIEQAQKMTIPEIFAKYGEDEFRRLEGEKIKELSKSTHCIISTGGGVVLNPNNMKVLKENGIVIFLNRDIDAIAGDIDTAMRPLLANGTEALYKIYNERLALYQKWCDIEISGNTTVVEAVENILCELQKTPL